MEKTGPSALGLLGKQRQEAGSQASGQRGGRVLGDHLSAPLPLPWAHIHPPTTAYKHLLGTRPKLGIRDPTVNQPVKVLGLGVCSPA